MASSIVPIQASTQEHIDILDILDDIVISKDGSCSMILQVTAINFDLLSQTEQDAIIYAYAGLLNSLTFPIQIMIRSAIKDVTNYINLIKQQEQKQKKQLLLDQLKQYRSFVETLIKDNRVLDKRFFVVIPFSSLELGLTPTLASSFNKTKKLPYPKPYILERAKMNLYPKRDHLMRQFARLGLQCRQLNTQQLIELFFSIYNEESVGQRIGTSKEYSAPMVTAKQVANPKSVPTIPISQAQVSAQAQHAIPVTQPRPISIVAETAHTPSPVTPIIQPSEQNIANQSRVVYQPKETSGIPYAQN